MSACRSSIRTAVSSSSFRPASRCSGSTTPSGRLLFERQIQGREIDDVRRAPAVDVAEREQPDSGEMPFVTPTIRTAAVDPSGHLWVSFAEPVTYEFDGDGDKIRAVQFRAAGLVSPNHMSFDEKGRMLVTPGLLRVRYAVVHFCPTTCILTSNTTIRFRMSPKTCCWMS